MRRKVLISILVTAILVAALAGAAASQGMAAGTESYTATVKYYDNVMLTYNLYYPSGGVWMGSGDIPIGGAGISSQIYCADPFVAFHSIADTSWEGTTTDRVNGYVAAAPWAASGAMQQNADAVRWLVLNGYRGDYLGNDQESMESVARLQSLYPDVGAIDKTIALMATKVSIWKTLAGDGVEIIRTSLDAARQAVFFALADAMVADAAWGRQTGEAMTGFTLTIEENKTDIVEATDHIYIPLTVTALLENIGGGADLDGVFLTASGPDADGVTFTDGADENAQALPYGTIYGTDESAQFLAGGSFERSGGDWIWESDVYLKIPANRAPDYGDLLTIRAMAGAGGVPVYPGTPVTLVYGSGGVQDWNYVQAFIGAAQDGMTADLYAEASVYTGSTSLGSIGIQKMLENNAPTDDDTEFSFAVYHNPASDSFDSATRLDLNAHPVRAAVSVNTEVAGSHYFTLKNGGQAFIDGIPEDHYYWVVELGPVSGYLAPEYAVPVAAAALGRDLAIEAAQGFRTNSLRMTGGTASTVFYNTKSVIEIEGEPDTGTDTDTDADMSINAHLRIGKIAIGLIEGGDEMTNVRGVEFEYTLQYRGGSESDWKPVNLNSRFSTGVSARAPDGEFGGGRLISAADGMFALNHYGEAYIELDPAYEYRVIETENPDYASAYALGIYEDGAWRAMTGGPVNAYWKDRGRERITDAFRLSSDGYYQIIFTNVDIPCHDLTIGKTVAEPGVRDELFQFEIVYTGGGLGAAVPWTVPLTTDPGVYEAMLVTGNDGLSLEGRITDGTILNLKHGESVTIADLFTGHFIVRELPKEGYAASYSINGSEAAPAIDGQTGDIHLAGAVRVDFVNTVAGARGVADAAGISDAAGTSGAPGGAEESDDGLDLGDDGIPRGGLSPQTGDERQVWPSVVLLVIGACCIVAAEFYRRRRA